MINLAIIASHPIQYYAPLFRCIAQDSILNIKVFYLWNFGITNQIDQGFKQSLKWDIPLLEGYNFEFVPNISKNQSVAISICRSTSCHSSSYVNICVSFDNRAVNIFDISNFCSEIKKNIENPYLMLFDK